MHGVIRYFLALILVSLVQNLCGQLKISYHDGPYVKYFKDSLEVLWIDDGKMFTHTGHRLEPYFFSHEVLPDIHVENLVISEEKNWAYDNILKWAAVSDIHGQLALFRDLLCAQQIINDAGKWTYGNGHLVSVGDVMDRGAHVIEALWFIYDLEHQAGKAGGKVHFLLGNHEVMVMNNHLDYIHQKYTYTSGITLRQYASFFNQNSFFGRWLSSKNIVVSINDNLFVHGGISHQVARLGFSLEEINTIFRNDLIYKSPEHIASDSSLHTLFYKNGPLWYRGYASSHVIERQGLADLVESFGLNSIIVGHTSMSEITGYRDNRIILVDSGIKNGRHGEILLWQDGFFQRGLLDGSRTPLISKPAVGEPRSIFTTIFNDPSPELRLSTAIKQVYKNDEETYLESVLSYTSPGGSALSFDIGLRTSGNMRRQICSKPPLKVNFKKKQLDSLGFSKSDKFKILFPCKMGSVYENHLRKEHLIYELYHIIDTFALRSKLATIIIDDIKKGPKETLGLIIEHQDHFAERTNSILVEKGIANRQAYDRYDFLTFCLFQYMIANPDWGVTSKHNLRTIKKPHKKALSALPYDFDYCGLIDTEYAVPSEKLPITRVTQRYFMDNSATFEEIKPVVEAFRLKEQAILDHINSADYIDQRAKKNVIRFIKKSFDDLSSDKKIKSNLNLKKGD